MCTFYLLATEPGLKADNAKDDDDGNYENDDVDDKNLVVFVARQKKIQFWSRIFREVGGSVGAKKSGMFLDCHKNSPSGKKWRIFVSCLEIKC